MQQQSSSAEAAISGAVRLGLLDVDQIGMPAKGIALQTKSSCRATKPIDTRITMNKLKIPHNAFVFVGDGRKALFLRNDGDEKFPNLKTEKVFEEENPSSHEQGTERPGRVSKGSQTGQRSAVEPTDWHDIEEHHFARKVAAALEQVIRERKVQALVVVAPPRTLAELRDAFHSDVKACIIAEINKDLTKQPVWEIEKHLTGDSGSH
ncbi:host attachment protein [Bradyrhizobium sp.]|uniref:baeRF12 domain-containing protein n=1 Tax=Bradyrhizobium sp. TaxID=376 RepID=UPI00351E128D